MSQTIAELVSGSGIELEDRGRQRLKGVAREWRPSGITDPGT